MVTPYRGDQLWLVPARGRPRPSGTVVIADFESGGRDGFVSTGAAFGPRALRATGSSSPPVGPVGGRFLYGSLGRGGDVGGVGTARSRPFVLPSGGTVEARLGSTGRVDALSAAVVDLADPRLRVELQIPSGRFTLSPVRWSVAPGWSGREVVLELRDDAKKAAIFVDDLWVTPAS